MWASLTKTDVCIAISSEVFSLELNNTYAIYLFIFKKLENKKKL